MARRPGRAADDTGDRSRPGSDPTSSRFDPDSVLALEPTGARVLGVHERDGRRHRLVEFRHALSHRSGMPVFEHASGSDPQVPFIDRRLGRCRIRPEEDLGLTRQRNRRAVGQGVNIAAGGPHCSVDSCRIASIPPRPYAPSNNPTGQKPRQKARSLKTDPTIAAESIGPKKKSDV
jgi:hypothetical protein